MIKKYFQTQNWISPAVLLIVSALAYLPFINQLGYFNDDWYLMYAGHSSGPSIFWLIYRYDRPARGHVLGRAYQLFGDEPLFYHLSAFLFRFLSGWAVYWLASKIWPRTADRIR